MQLGSTCNSYSNTHRFPVKEFTKTHDYFGLNHKDHNQATEAFIADRIKDKVLQQLSYHPRDIVLNIEPEFGVIIIYSKGRRMKELALKLINGSHEDVYS